MFTTSHDNNHGGKQEFLVIKQDDKFFSWLLSKENSNGGGESSLRFYYHGGSSGSIPFHWESQPGTPKRGLDEYSCMLNPHPLTPPPSYYTPSGELSYMQKQHSKLINFFPSIFHRKTSRSSAPAPQSSPPPVVGFNGRRRRHRARSDYLFELENIYGDDRVSAAAAPPFSGGRSRRSKGFGRFYYVKNMKRAFFSVVGHGPS